MVSSGIGRRVGSDLLSKMAQDRNAKVGKELLQTPQCKTCQQAKMRVKASLCMACLGLMAIREHKEEVEEMRK